MKRARRGRLLTQWGREDLALFGRLATALALIAAAQAAFSLLAHV